MEPHRVNLAFMLYQEAVGTIHLIVQTLLVPAKHVLGGLEILQATSWNLWGLPVSPELTPHCTSVSLKWEVMDKLVLDPACPEHA
eukprot:11100344-Ditylum_brightwellii.AAC.1